MTRSFRCRSLALGVRFDEPCKVIGMGAPRRRIGRPPRTGALRARGWGGHGSAKDGAGTETRPYRGDSMAPLAGLANYVVRLARLRNCDYVSVCDIRAPAF